VNRSSHRSYSDSLTRISPFPFLISQEVSSGYSSVLSSSSNLNSPTPQEQSGNIVGADDDVGMKETDGDVDRTKDGGVEGVVDGAEEEEGIKEGREVGVVVGRKEKLGLKETDGTADGTPRLASHGISILDEL